MNAWLANIVVVSLIPSFLFINYFILMHFNIKEPNKWTFSKNIFIFFGAICQQGSESQPKFYSTRMIFFYMFLLSVYLLQTFSASYTSFLSVNVEQRPFETVEDLYKNTDYKIGSLSGVTMLQNLIV